MGSDVGGIWLMAAATLLLGSAGCGGETSTTANQPTTTTTSSTTTTKVIVSLEDAQDDWDRTILPTLIGVAYSAAIEVHDGEFEAITIGGSDVEVWDFSDEGWGRSGQRLTLEFPVAVFGEEVTLLQADDLTGDGVDDVVAPLYGNDPVGAVLVRTAQEWVNATFVGESYPESLTLQGRDLVSFHNDCVPSCGEGNAIQRLWEWNGMAFEAPPLPAPPTTTTAPPALIPGRPCTRGSHQDCIDPDGFGDYVYLIGGGDCMDTFAPDSSGLCSDLDGDGYAGYPDSG